MGGQGAGVAAQLGPDYATQPLTLPRLTSTTTTPKVYSVACHGIKAPKLKKYEPANPFHTNDLRQYCRVYRP